MQANITAVDTVMHFTKLGKLPEYHMFQLFLWGCADHNLGEGGLIDPE